ncbi:MAG: tRNA (adenosine(37)-N6)-threonylcarbamoyltransferase complex dimerization subunit type 1 TsaB [Treponema sp.]|nr:tRNA (adenosine(37)-N6)-threonylcarbamoyltransferase complex dimerization subunit type 1 TsaB [Treponema sp.]
MKALALDTAATRFCVAVKNESSVISAVYDIGMKQSETLLPAIDELMKKADVLASDLDYTALCGGPGSFTGLRLAFAALKAVSHAHNVPLYAIPTLEAHAFPYRALPFPVASAINAKKNKFYCACFERGSEIVKAGDYTVEAVAANLENALAVQQNTRHGTHNATQSASSVVAESPLHCTAAVRHIVCCGPDATLFAERMNALYENMPAHASAIAQLIFTPLDFSTITTDALFALAEERIAQSVAPLADYGGPLYLRASEAEEKLHEQYDNNKRMLFSERKI